MPLKLDRFAIVGLALAIPVATVSFTMFDGIAAALSCLLGLAMVTIAVIDARDYIIPDFISLPAIPAGILAIALTGDYSDPDSAVLRHIAAALIGGSAAYGVASIYCVVRGQDGLGLGDVKLFAAAGAWTGFHGLPLVLLAACAGALVFTLILAMLRNGEIGRTTMIPFGVFLAPSIWVVWSLLLSQAL